MAECSCSGRAAKRRRRVGFVEIESLAVLLEALYLDPAGPTEGHFARVELEWIVEWLRLQPDRQFGNSLLRHAVAIQLAPRSAINYSPSNPRPRWTLVEEYLRDRVVLDDQQRERVARV